MFVLQGGKVRSCGWCARSKDVLGELSVAASGTRSSAERAEGGMMTARNA